jgi:hypothetical protein
VACTTDLPVASLIDKVRVLGVQSEPAEAAPGDQVVLQALAVEPVTSSAPLSTIWLACSFPPGNVTPLPCGVAAGTFGAPDAGTAALPHTCTDDPNADPCIAGAGLGTSYHVPPAIGLSDKGLATVLLTFVVADRDTALDCLIATSRNDGQPVDPDHCVIALKRLPVSDRVHVPNPNQNPELSALTIALDGAPLALDRMQPVHVPASPEQGTRPKYTIEIDRAAGSAEQNADGTFEQLAVSWFTTAGSILGRSTFQAPTCSSEAACANQEPPFQSQTEWTAPKAFELATVSTADGAVHFWVVVRDDRGGVAWSDGEVEVATP